MAKKGNTGSFGAPGRKGGRTLGTPNKATAALKVYAGQFTQEAIDGLLSIARGSKVPPQAKVSAWREILDRAVGKAPQAVTGPDGESLLIPSSIQFVFQQQPDSENRT